MPLFRNLLILSLVLVQASANASNPASATPKEIDSKTAADKPNGQIQPETILTDSKNLIPKGNESPTEFADAELKSIGIPDATIHLIHALYLSKNKKLNKAAFKNKDWMESATQVVSLNVFGFLSQSNYMAHDSPLARKKIKRYLKDHKSSFRAIRSKYPVSPNAIASLLWVETKHGKTVGNFPLPWVFYSLVMGAHPQFVKLMMDQLPERMEKGNPKNLTLQIAQEKVIERCRAKAGWALEELKALQQIQVEHDFNPFKYKASFAGAFGIPQFIPSTYLKLAVSEFRTKPDLFKHSDAIASVAHFLHSNGWNNKDPESQETALFSYNRSKDYGAVILKLSQEVSDSI